MRYYVVDAFTDQLFSGNPAGVCVMEDLLPDSVMQQIAAENCYSETAFLMPVEDSYLLRWFTPKFEIDLCGHATLAAAYVVFRFLAPKTEAVNFFTVSGKLCVTRHGSHLEMVVPKRTPTPVSITPELIDTLGITPVSLYGARDLCVMVSSEQEVVNYVPDYEKLRQLSEYLGITLTSQGTDCDFVSRFFCPSLGLEDPVTGSSHTSLVPLWCGKLGKTTLVAKQRSQRGGVLYCTLGKTDVTIAGQAALYLQGEIMIPPTQKGEQSHGTIAQ